jgi:hypothetical protein
MHESKRSRSKGKMLAGFRRIKPADILIGVFLVGWPFFNLASRYFLSRPGATVESVAVWLIPLRCPINWLTGFMCPTCGLGRSFLLSLNGDFSKAFELHFLGPALAVLIWVCSYFIKEVSPTDFKCQRVRQWAWFEEISGLWPTSAPHFDWYCSSLCPLGPCP